MNLHSKMNLFCNSVLLNLRSVSGCKLSFGSNSSLLYFLSNYSFQQNHFKNYKRDLHSSTVLNSSNSTKNSKGIGPIKWRNLILVLGIGSSFVLYAQILKKEKQKLIEKHRKEMLRKANIGAEFHLIDHTGKPCTNSDLRGKWLLIYFGFTHCPDICPEEMEKLAEIIEILDKNKKMPKILPIMITVDPDRDTVQVLGKYVEEFSPKIIGLTGSKEEIEKVAKGYHVYFQIGPKDDDNDYIVDHTINIYLVSPDGDFVDYYGRTKSAEQISSAVTKQITKFLDLRKSSWFGIL